MIIVIGSLKNVTNELDYFKVNTDLTINIFDAFLKSKAKTFLYFSSVKAVKDHFDNILTEDVMPSPSTAYGKSKLAAENYLHSNLEKKEKNAFLDLLKIKYNERFDYISNSKLFARKD